MKKISTIVASFLVLLMAVVLTGCNKKADYDEYLGYQFSGKDPWGNELAVTIRTLENDKLTFTYTDVIGSGSDSVTVYSEATATFKDGSAKFNVKGKADDSSYTFDYNGVLTLKDGNVEIKYETGAITEKSTNGDSDSYQVGPLEDAKKAIVLKKVVDNN